MTVPSKWILLVEDDPESSMVIRELLTYESGLKVRTAAKASEGIQLLRNQRFDCILVDLHLEQGSGETLIEHVRKDSSGFNYNTPILVVSAHLDREVLLRLKDFINGAIAKPFTQEVLLKRVQELISPALVES